MWGNPCRNLEAPTRDSEVPRGAIRTATQRPFLTTMLPTSQDLRVQSPFLAAVSNPVIMGRSRGGDAAFRYFWRCINQAANGLCTRRLEGCTETAAPNSKTCRSCCAERNRKQRARRVRGVCLSSQGALIRRFSGDPVQSIVSIFKAGGAGGGSPPHFLF